MQNCIPTICRMILWYHDARAIHMITVWTPHNVKTVALERQLDMYNRIGIVQSQYGHCVACSRALYDKMFQEFLTFAVQHLEICEHVSYGCHWILRCLKSENCRILPLIRLSYGARNICDWGLRDILPIQSSRDKINFFLSAAQWPPPFLQAGLTISMKFGTMGGLRG